MLLLFLSLFAAAIYLSPERTPKLSKQTSISEPNLLHSSRNFDILNVSRNSNGTKQIAKVLPFRQKLPK